MVDKKLDKDLQAKKLGGNRKQMPDINLADLRPVGKDELLGNDTIEGPRV